MALKTAIIPDLAKIKASWHYITEVNLLIIKDEQERIRQGLRENVRVSNEMYDEHFKQHVPKLKKTYWQKCQALEVSLALSGSTWVTADKTGSQAAGSCDPGAGQTAVYAVTLLSVRKPAVRAARAYLQCSASNGRCAAS
jgi:hypothetical protein